MNDTTVPDEQRAERIADIRAFADWLEQNPWIPTPDLVDASKHLNGTGQSAEEQRKNLDVLESVADRLGIEVGKGMNDRTRMTANVGKFEYRLLVWHENGRPGQLDERDAELERLRAEVAALRSGVGLVDEPYPNPVCVYDTGDGNTLRRRCGVGIWRDGPTGEWRHIGNTWHNHEAVSPVSESR
ncbi:hypothetical protein [Actinoplanes palleronii]|uniref:Uncharacterized protein n=1 Tax=Actinoplanes palleronii TaxID=113570 RepID=A0ABQ4BJF4_9ACTN|nr:hypothetical protein [Actinoplanes palleronii]GIE70783.1 hypothetical protein Apa02nite_068910 [Actinoplanes palleronii]